MSLNTMVIHDGVYLVNESRSVTQNLFEKAGATVYWANPPKEINPKTEDRNSK